MFDPAEEALFEKLTFFYRLVRDGSIMMSQNERPIWSTARPWTKEQIVLSTFQDLVRTLQTIDSLPGGKIFSELEAIHLSLNVLLDATYDLLSSINLFKGESERADFWNKPRRTDLERLELRIQRGIFSATMAAMALVDHSRTFIKNYPVEHYHETIKESFSANPLHRFIQLLRNFMTHVRIAKSNWVVKWDKQGRSVFFILTATDLDKWEGWDSPSRSYIESNPEGINIEQLFDDYSKRIKLFHDWFRCQVWEKNGEDLREYLACKRMYNAVNARSMWGLLLKQAFPQKKIDPYMYLDRYLSDNEIEEILSLPFRSKSQVDRIIELADEYGCCDEELRKAAYIFFEVIP
jgi:hypothetical protein